MALNDAGEPTEATLRAMFERMVDPTPLSARRGIALPASRAAILTALAGCDTRAPRWIRDELGLARSASYGDAVAELRKQHRQWRRQAR